jgi:hypothetical protein
LLTHSIEKSSLTSNTHGTEADSPSASAGDNHPDSMDVDDTPAPDDADVVDFNRDGGK